MSMLTGPCPKCGKGLQIPEDLQNFSCMYCGARLTRDDLLCDGAEELFARLSQDLVPCVTGQTNTISYLTPQKYPERYAAYKESYGETLSQINQLPTACHETLAETLLERVDRWAQSSRRPDALLEDAKYTICLLLVPALRELAPWQGYPFCQTLRTAWLKHYPKRVFQLTTYEEIAGGFHRNKLCFITTAVCAYQGKPDDCRELTAFRSFRDGWLSRQPDGKALIQTYYELAPSIVTAIDVTDPDRAYPAIWENYLLPCLRLLEAKDHPGCKTHYEKMVRTLSRTYLHQ